MRQAGDPQHSVDLFNELIPYQSSAKGPDHLSTLRARHDHAVGVRETGDTARAIVLLNKLIPDCTRALGPNHAHTLRVRAYLDGGLKAPARP